jgi:hypothetical protein
MKINRRAVLFAVVMLPSLATAQEKVTTGGQVFDGTARVAGSQLLLNGTGVRKVAWFTGYAAGLYLTSRASTAAQVQTMSGAKRLQMRMSHDVPALEFTKALRKGVARNCSAGEFAALGERLEQFAGLIDTVGEVKKNDVVDLDLDPGRGLVLRINGKARGEAIAGHDLYAALLRAFVGERPYDEKLRAGLLGQPV